MRRPRAEADTTRPPPSKERKRAEPPIETGALPRGLAVLEAMIAAERPLALAELAEAVKLSPSTTHRLVQTLAQSGYAFRDAGGRILPTPRALSPLGLHHPLNLLRRAALPVLRDVQKRFGPTAAMSVVMGTQRMVLEISPGEDNVTPYFGANLQSPLHASASGKILLSRLSPSERSALIGEGPYAALTPRTITDRAQLDRELERTLARGYAENTDEHWQGISAVGAPIHLDSGRLFGSIVLTGPSRYFSAERNPEMAGELKAAAHLFAVASPPAQAVRRFLGL
jgi:IclR family acetate operon transcriptional repressor